MLDHWLSAVQTGRGSQVRQKLLTALVVASLVACETATGPSFGTGGGTSAPALGLTAAQASGSWSFTLRRTLTGFDCPNGGLIDGQLLNSQITVSTDGTVAVATSAWQYLPNTPVRPLSGQVRLSDGFTDILFRAGGTNLSSAMRLQGSMTSTGTFSGTMTDPAPGFNPVFSISGCFYNVTGTRTG